ncbi:MAG: hypothetical protein ACF8LL_08630, partial [Phycisphaerales bacterium]
WDPTDPEQIPVFVKITRFYFGWPFRAMHYDLIGISTESRWDHMRSYFDRVEAAAGINIGLETPDWWPAVRENYKLPVLPRIGGLILNTLTFAAVWACIASSFRWTIRTKRRRTGRCAECAYQIEELQLCPECGTPRS